MFERQPTNSTQVMQPISPRSLMSQKQFMPASSSSSHSTSHNSSPGIGHSAVSISVTTASHTNPTLSQSELGTSEVDRHLCVRQKLLARSASSGITLAMAGSVALQLEDGRTTKRQKTLHTHMHRTAVPKPNNRRSSVKPGSFNNTEQSQFVNSYSMASRASLEAQSNRTAMQSCLHQPQNIGKASVHVMPLSPKGVHTYRQVVGGKPSVLKTVESTSSPSSAPSPQSVFDKMLQSRGYSSQTFCSLESAYYCKPTPLQKSSYGMKLIQAVRNSDETLMRNLLETGISLNPCNAFGESIVHMVCRRGDYKLLKMLVDYGCSLQVTDDFGRTPLHDACWTAEPCFQCVELILDTDVNMLRFVDCRGSSPMSYIKSDHWDKWNNFFGEKAEKYWSPRSIAEEGDEPPPPLSMQPAHSRPMQDPKNAVSLEMAALLVSGKKCPVEYITERDEQIEKIISQELLMSR